MNIIILMTILLKFKYGLLILYKMHKMYMFITLDMFNMNFKQYEFMFNMNFS